MKKWLTALMVLMLVLSVFAGCSAKVETPQEEKPEKKVTLKFSIWGKEAHKKMYEEMAAKYSEQHPHITVEIMTIPNTEYLQKLSIMNASKTAPDIVWLTETMIPQFLETDQLLDISRIKSDSAYNFKDIFPSTLQLLTKGDKLYGIPFSTPPIMVYYNKTLFKEKGLKTPTELYKEGNWTYDEFMKAAKAITNSEKGVYGVNFTRDSWDNWLGNVSSILGAYGAELLSEDGTKFTLNTKGGEQALQMYYNLIFKDKVHPKPGDQITFETGKIGIQQQLYSYMGKAREIKDFEWDIAPMPEGPAGRGTWVGFAGYSILKGTKHPEEALDFLKYVTNPDNAKTTAQFFVPSRKSILESEDFAKAAPSPESMKIAVLEQMGKAKSLIEGHKNWQQVDTKMRTLFDYLYTKDITVKQVLDLMEKEVSPLLK